MKDTVLVALTVALAVTAPAGQVGQVQRPGAAGEWRHYAGDGGSMKYSPLDEIRRANVARLHTAFARQRKV